MERETGAQASSSQEQIKALNKMLNQILREKKIIVDLEDPYFTTGIPVTDLTAYPELTKYLPSIEEDFFRSTLTEAERKIAKHSCPRTSSMNYIPPTLNDTALSTYKKAGSALYWIQLALAQKALGKNIPEDTNVLFSSTMRALLAEIATTDLSSKLTQLIESETRSIMYQEAFDALITKKPLTPAPQMRHSTEFQIFAEGVGAARGSLSGEKTGTSSRRTPSYVQGYLVKDNRQQTQTLRRQIRHLYKRKLSPDISKVISKEVASLLLKQAIEEINPRGPEFYNQLFTIPNKTGGLRPVLDLLKLNIIVEEQKFVIPAKMNSCIYRLSRFKIWTIADTFGIHQDSLICIEIGQIERNAILGLFGRSANNEILQERVYIYHTQDIPQALGAWIQVQRREIRYDTQGAVQRGQGSQKRGQQVTERWPEDIEMFGGIYYEIPIDEYSPNARTSYSLPTCGALKSLSVDFEIMDIGSDYKETSHPEPIFLEESAEVVKRALVIARE
ncbi:hypothetical protein AYI68_g4057 [Smittium mucronatum]|uniref:Uncharacterized protein n=1 Tax=Smittium mucronatum TaxID=133383 RepID=A0A1R0GY77_9FUNG|nr:hypothetical protein AYI68_g4057 [Smittium mucronatum]